MIVVITDEAEADLERIADYIAIGSPRRAASFVRELFEKCHQLADMPLGFPLVAGFEVAGVHRRVHGDYLIFYSLDRNTIHIIRILNGGQNYQPILFPRG